jgi:hypothetical protein
MGSRSRKIALLVCAGLLCTPALAQTPPASHRAKPPSPKAAASRAAPPRMDVLNWFSLAPAPGSAEARLGMRAEAERKADAANHVETITVFGTRRAPTEEALHHDEPTAESWQSDAAQSYVPGIGESCTYKSGCFDNAQPGLFDSLPKLFGGD